jgi:predicted metal-dependent hydrolase
MKATIDTTIATLRKIYQLDYLWYSVFDIYDSNALAEANIISKQITFSPKLFNSNIGSGYKKERAIQNKYNLNQKEFIKWIVCHEYAHIYYKENKHTNDFFNKVEQMYLQLNNNN